MEANAAAERLGALAVIEQLRHYESFTYVIDMVGNGALQACDRARERAVVRGDGTSAGRWRLTERSMRFSNQGAGIALRVVAAGAVLLTATGWAAADEAGAAAARGESALWTPKELLFIYQGFTTRYSCDGLRDKVRSILLELGAREDLKVTETPCSELGRPDPFPGVRIKMNVLQPATDKSATAGTQLVPAHWKRIDFTPDRDAVSAAGECELVEQVKQSILPLFATRNVEYTSTCVPHQLQIGATRLRAEVLVPDQKNAKPAGSG